MPLSKYHIRNEYGMADPELYRAAEKDDPEALLEAVAMAGLVGLLRQLGDLAEFAAEIFHDLHEEVMATAARGHGLMTRVQQLEAEVPSLEKAFLSQTHHSSFFTNGGVDWRPNLRSEQNIVTHGDIPRFIMDSYEECRGPPRLFLLDKFDVAGAGACLKRYTDPSFFKMESASAGTARVEVHRDKRIRKVKKKGARLRDGESPNVVPSHAKLHQLLLEDRIENGYTDPARLVKLKKRQLNGSAVEPKSGKSYMAKFLETPSPDHKMIYETSIVPLSVNLASDDTSEAGVKTLEISSISTVKNALGNGSTYSSLDQKESELRRFSEVNNEENGDFSQLKEQISAGTTDEISSNHLKLLEETKLAVNGQKEREGILDGYHSDDVTSEVDNYMDALTTMESELDTDNECKPKNGFLNIQKMTETNGKEERQIEARFSYSQSFGDSSTSDEISSFKQDRNEDHIEVQARLSDSHSPGTSSASDNNSSFRRHEDEPIEMQAQFSDSQSIGNSSISDDNSSFKKDRSYFHNSESLSSVVENKHSENILFPNTNHFDPEIEDKTSKQLPQIFEFQNTDYGKYVVHDDARVQKEEISDLGQASSDPMSSGHALCSDVGPTSPQTLTPGSQSDEAPFDPVELNLRSGDDGERTGLTECSAAAKPVSLYQDKYDANPKDSSDKKSLENLDDHGALVHSDVMLQDSSNVELVHENACSDHYGVKKLRWKSHNKSSSEDLVGRDMDSSGEDSIPPPTKEFNLDSGIIPVLDCRDSKDEDCLKATQINLEDLSPTVEIPPETCLAGELSSDLSHNNPQDEPGSVENEVLCSDAQSNVEERPKWVHGDEVRRSTFGVDPVEGDGHFNHPSSSDKDLLANDVVADNCHSEDQAVFAVPSLNNAEKDASIITSLASCSPSRSPSNLQEPLSGLSDSCQMEMESDKVELTQISMGLNAEKEENQLQPTLDLSSFDRHSLIMNQTEMEESLSDVADSHEKEIEDNEAVDRESSTELEEQQIVDQTEIASADVQLKLEESVPCDISDSERCNNIQNSSLMEKFQQVASVGDLKMVPEFSGLDGQQPESLYAGQNDPLLNDTHDFSSPTCIQLENETNSVVFSEPQVGELDAEFLVRGEENLASEKSQSQQMQSCQMEQESTYATPGFASEAHVDELASSHSLPQSSGEEVNLKNHLIPLKPPLPDLVPKAAESNLDDMPPMPPLPPMQWRMGKVQHASLFSQREEVEVRQASAQPMLPSFQPMSPSQPDKNFQFGLPTSRRETLLYQSPFVPVMGVETDNLQSSSGFPLGVSGHPAALPFQFPIMVNEAQGQYKYIVLDRSQIQNPFLTLPVVTAGMPPHGYIVAPEGEMANSNLYLSISPAESAVSVSASISPQENLSQPPSQLAAETSSDVKTLEQSISHVVSTGQPREGDVSEGEVVQNSNLCPSIPPVNCVVSENDSMSAQEPSQPLRAESTSEANTFEQSSTVVSTVVPPHVDDVASEGEIVQCPNLSPPILPAECAVSGCDSVSHQEKPFDHPIQLVSQASSEGAEGHPSFSLMSPPKMESMESYPNFITSEVEAATSLDTPAQTSDLDGERANGGKPKNKLPRPRSPLIDAVAAHDKSKLRKVTERVMPPTAPKVDERDSLLEQIRTKSFNLKPTVATRPSIQGPKTNLKLAAILEKANSIRQALAGSDEDDSDSWSDS